jgi:antitoxin component YwqK of YwqJK toxin-antitoxin module/TolA-binding protein
MKILILFSISILISSAQIVAQRCTSLNLNSGEIIKSGYDFHEEKEYQKAMIEYKRIPSGDTNFYTAQYELALSLVAQLKYQEAINILEIICKEDPDDLGEEAIHLMGDAYDDLGEHGKAREIYNGILKTRPYYYRAYYDLAVSYSHEKNYEEAEKYLMLALRYNPYHQRSHYLLGSINYAAKRYVEGYLCMMTGAYLNSSSKLYLSCVSAADEMSSMNYKDKDISNIKLATEFESHQVFNTANENFEGMLAVSAKYKVKKLPLYPCVKQGMLLFDQLKDIEQTNNFYSSFYLELLKRTQALKLERGMMLATLQNLNIDEVKKLIKNGKNISEMKAFYQVVGDFFKEYGKNIELTLDNETEKYDIQYYSNGSFLAIKDEFNVKFNNLGRRYETSYVKDGVTNGVFTNYNEKNGQKEYELTVKNNIIDGEVIIYGSNEVKTEVKHIVKSELQDAYTSFHPNGKVQMEGVFKDGKRNGLFVNYYSNGQLESKITYLNGLAEGDFEKHFANGNLESKGTYKKNFYHGEMTEYFANAAISKTGSFIDGVLVGEFNEYYANGKKMKEGSNDEKGNPVGKIINYYFNGVIEEEIEFKEGKKQGKGISYTEEGIKFIEFTYNKGDLTKIIYFDKAGKVISESNEQRGVIKYDMYDPYGQKMESRSLGEKGLIGERIKYFPGYDEPRLIEQYKDGLLNGIQKDYDAPKVLSYDLNYTDGKADGYCKVNSKNGKTLREMCYVDGKRNGIVNSNNLNGELVVKSFMVDNKLNGDKEYYVNGKIIQLDHYDHGKLKGYAILDTAGNRIHDFVIGEGKFVANEMSKSGKLMSKATYYDFELNDSLIYFSGFGTPIYKANLVDNLVEGKLTRYFVNGALRQEQFYFNGELFGENSTYYHTGVRSYKEYSLNGEENGITELYYPNGKLLGKFPMNEDVITGVAVFYDELGNEATKISYWQDNAVEYTYKVNGTWVPAINIPKNNGVVKSFHSNGKVHVDRTEIDGVKDGKEVIYYSTGQVFREREFILGEENGCFKTYNLNGKLLFEENFVNGERSGISKYYNENGTLNFEINYLNDEYHGLSKLFDKSGKLLKSVNFYYGIPQ